MADIFRLGELALVHYPGNELHGQIVEIASLLGKHRGFPRFAVQGEDFYVVVDDRGREWGCVPDVLRKLPPPDPSKTDVNRKTTWDAGVWKPTSAKA